MGGFRALGHDQSRALMKTVAIIESRMTSKRLPGKNLKDIEGKPMLARLIGRLRQTQTLDQICLATSTDPS